MERLPLGSGLDRISDLPSNVIDHILGFLPLKDAVRTSTFSKKWKDKWHTSPNIIVNEHHFHERTQQRLEGIINYILCRHEGRIEKFSISLESINDPYNLMLWIWRLSEKRVQDLSLVTHSGRYHELPSVLYSCQKLRNLNLRHCEVKPCHSFRGFQNLFNLQLNKVNMEAAAFERLISSCPLLEKLTVRKLSCIAHLRINVPKLKYFFFDGEFKSMSFNTPILEVLSVRLCRIGSEINQFDLRFRFRGLPSSMKELYIRCQFQRYVAASWDVFGLVMYSQLRTLWLDSFCFEKMDQVACLLSLIGNSPSLAILDITSCYCTGEAVSEPLEKFWEDQNDADFPMDRLKKVTVRSFHGRISEIKFMEFVMANSPILEELTVESVTNPEFEEDEMKAALLLHCQELTQFKFIGGDYESSSDGMSDSDDNSVGSYASDYYD